MRRLQAEGAPIASTLPTSILGPLDPGLSEANHALRTFARDVVLLTTGCFSDHRRARPGGDAREADRAGAGSGPLHREHGEPDLGARSVTGSIEATGVRVRRVKMGGGVLRSEPGGSPT